MKVIDINIGDFETVEIHTFADLHIGDQYCDMNSVKRRIEYVKNTPNAYALLNGDLFNNATKTSVSDSYAELLPPMEQIQEGVDLFEPIAHKILALCTGNHENRTYNKEGIDLMNLFARQLRIFNRFCAVGGYIFLNLGTDERRSTDKRHRPLLYTIYMTHGSGGGKKEGGKIQRLMDMADKLDADIYIHSHTHVPAVLKGAYYRCNRNSHSLEKATRLFVNTSSELDWGGYAEQFELKPSALITPTIYLDGRKFGMEGKL